MTRTSRISVVVLAITAVVAMAAPAFAAWLVTATNPTANAKATALGPVTGLGTSVTSTSVTLSWTPPAGVPALAYTVTRTSPSSATPCSATTNTTCNDTGLTSGVTYQYSVVALRNNWTSSAATTSATTTAVANFLVTPAAGPYTAGASFSVTIQARVGTTNDTSYRGNKTLSIGGSNAPDGTAPTMTASPVAFDTNGTATVNVTLFKAGSNTFSISEATPGTRTGSATLTVVAGKAKLGFTATTVGGSSVTCSPTTAFEIGGNHTVLTTKVVLLSTDSWGNSVTLPSTGTVSVTMAFNASATSHYNTPSSPGPLTIALPTTTSSNTFSAERSDSTKFSDGLLTATDGSGTYAPATCALAHS